MDLNMFYFLFHLFTVIALLNYQLFLFKSDQIAFNQLSVEHLISVINYFAQAFYIKDNNSLADICCCNN